ncbi:MAG: choice-of-anchor Q domain-containing protein [Planctomycetota bacterium]
MPRTFSASLRSLRSEAPGWLHRLWAASGMARSRRLQRPAADLFEALEERRLLATFTVDSLADTIDGNDGVTTLREAIIESNASVETDLIRFDAALAGGTLSMTMGQFDITRAVRIEGLDAGLLTIDAQGGSRVFDVNLTDGGEVTLSKMTITGGSLSGNNAGAGAAIFNAGTLALRDMVVRDNTISGGSFGFGGGVFAGSGATLTIFNSLITDNTANWGGGVFIESSATATLDGVTISGNTVNSDGGGLLAQSAVVNVLVRGSTITNNSTSSASRSGGLIGEGTDNVVLISTIVAGNTNANGPADITNTGVDIDASSNNLIGVAAEAFTDGLNGNIVTADPGLLPLAFYGGDFETHALEADSPAIDAGLNPNNETRDGRGSSFYIRSFGSGPDIGAFERQTRGYFVDVDTDVNDGVLDPGELSLREALREANANPGRDAITFDESITQISQSASAGGQWVISDALTLTGTGADRLDISGSFVSRVFNIDDGDGANEIDVSISDVTIKFGSVSGGANGGGILSRENVTLTRVEVDDNRVFGTGSVGGGIHIFGNGSLTMIDSAVTRNSSDGTSGGINIASAGGATITGSTISGNRTEGNAGGIGVFVGDVTIRNSTIANNRADDRNTGGGVGGGLYVIIPPTQGSVTLESSLFAGNVIGFFSTGTRDDIRNLAGLDTAASRNNLVETTGVNAGGLTNGVDGNIVGADAMLLPLNDYGGPVRTHGIVEGSPAIDAGSGGGATDIRGGVFQRSVGAGPDIGALEFQVFNFTVDNAGDVSDGDLSPGQLTLREALEIVGPNPGAETIRFSEALAGQTILLTGTQLEVGPETTIEGLGADRLTIDAQGLSRVLFATSFGSGDLGDTIIRGLSITGGRVENNDGAGIRSQADGLVLDGVHVFGNRLVDDVGSFEDGGAGLHSTGNRTVIRNSTFSDNEGDGYGGAAFIGSDTLEVTNSTFSNNRTDAEGGAFYFGRNLNSASIRNSTFFRNQADADNDGGELGGAIYSALGGTDVLTLVSVLFASDTAAGVPNTLQFNDPTFVNFAQSTNNLFSNAGSSATLVNGTNGNLISVNPRVGPLADNGGATPTHRPLPGSPAINNGANPDALSADQRGLARVADGAPDIGAFEYRRPIIGDFDLVSNLPAGEPAGTFKPLRGVLLRT